MYSFVFKFLKMANYRRNMSEGTSLFTILGAVAKLRKATTGFVMSVRPPVHLHGTTRFPLKGFPRNDKSIFRKPVQKISSFINPLNAELNPIFHLLALLGAHHILHVSRIRVKSLTRITGTLHEDRCTFMITSRSVLLRMKNISD